MEKKSSRVDTFELPQEVRESFGTPRRSADGAIAEQVFIARRELTPGIESWTVRNSTRLWGVFHTTYAFCAPRAIKQNAAPKWRYRRRDYEMDLGSVRLLEPGEAHVTLRNPHTDFDVLQVDASLVYDVQVGLPVHFGSGQIEDREIAHGLLYLCARLRDAEEDFEIEGLWCEFRELLLERAGTRPTRAPALCPRAVSRARDYLHANFASRVSLGEVASVTGLSKFHLNRSFRDCLGIPLHRYLVKIRLAHAQALLKAGRRLTEVAVRTGFCDAPHLSRTFAIELGINPGAYASARTVRAR